MNRFKIEENGGLDLGFRSKKKLRIYGFGCVLEEKESDYVREEENMVKSNFDQKNIKHVIIYNLHGSVC